MTFVVDEFTSDYSRALEQSLRDNNYNFAVRNIVALGLNDKCLVSDAKIPLRKPFAFNDHSIFHSTKTNIRDSCDVTIKITARG